MIQRESIWNGYDASNKNLNEKDIEVDVRNLQGASCYRKQSKQWK
jgi:hypothetical protein